MATRTSLMEFQIPRIVHEQVDDNRGVFVIEPLDRGFGYTFGNSLRRVLLSSLEGAAVTSVKIAGVAHAFTTLPGVREDVTDILLNFKNLICRLHGDSPEIEVRLTKKGPGAVKASDIEAPAELEILNPDLEIANLSDRGKLEVTLTIGRGRGYVPAELNRGPEHTIGVIPIDSIFSHLDRIEGLGEATAAEAQAEPALAHGMENFPIEELELGVRSYNCLKRVGIETIGDLVTKTENELAAIPNFGKKSIEEVKETLATHGLTLRGENGGGGPAPQSATRERGGRPGGATSRPADRP